MNSGNDPTGDAVESDAPAGFTPLYLPGPFVDINGPLLARYTDSKFRIGLRLEERHCNAVGICHGGMHATFADLQIAIGIVVQANVRAFMPTINLSLDYVAPGRIGDWLEGETEVIRTTRNLAFGSCILSANGSTVVRASAVCKIPSQEDLRFTLENLLPHA
jgi:uncharacterized protein (TIGR00369 family)